MNKLQRSVNNEKRVKIIYSKLFVLSSLFLALSSLLLAYTPAFADGPKAWLRIDYTNSSLFTDGKKTQETNRLFQNYYFQFDKSITPSITYQLYIRTAIDDLDTTDSEGIETKTYNRSVEPAFHIQLRNPMYGISTGYRHIERWTTAHLSDEGRRTTEYFYSRFDLTPHDLPFLSIQFDKEKNYDHLSERLTDNTNTRYSASSWYDLKYRGLKLSYNITFTRDEDKNHVNEKMPKLIQNNLNVLYDINYHKSLSRDILTFSVGYQGNYNWSENKQFTTETGPVSFKRTPSIGMYGLGTQLEPEVDTLSSVSALSDEVYNESISTISGIINIGSNGTKYYNIGIQLFSSERPVDTIYLYVNKDVTLDTNLSNPSNWKAFASDFNLPGTWSEISIQSITVSKFVDKDILTEDIYRYEIKFSSPQKNIHFKVINMDISTIRDVFVTEIEAYGTDNIPQSGKITQKTVFFSHGINLNTTLKPIEQLLFSFNYFLNRSDQEPKSIGESIGGAFSNILSKSLPDGEEELRVNVMRSYGATARWLTHRLLTTTFRFQRSEAFDNKNETDFSSNSYSLSFYSNPIKTLDTNLSLIRTYNYSFSEKQSMNDLYLLTIGSKLYKDLHMITDIGYTKARSYAIESELSSENSESSTRYIRGTIDARFTPDLTTNITYGYSQTSEEESTTISKDGSVIVTYRPGRFISLTGTFKISDVNGDLSTTEGIFIDWLFVPAIRLNAMYEHSNTGQQSITTDQISGYVMWYITKFLDLQLTYNYQRRNNETETEVYNFGGILTCRFW